nr:integrase-type DNA-binding superfamily protein [Tanacetum cinerariifolium]
MTATSSSSSASSPSRRSPGATGRHPTLRGIRSRSGKWVPVAMNNEFMDEEALFDMPNLLADMAEGMLMSPPRHPSTDDHSPEDSSDCDNLWSY